MLIDLMPWIILWAVVSSGALLLALWRLMVVHQEHKLGCLHVAGSDIRTDTEEARISQTLDRIDRWGITLTVIAGVLIAGIWAAWLHNGWLKANEMVR